MIMCHASRRLLHEVSEMAERGIVTGLKPSEELWNIDIYCMLEAPQELFFGLEPRVELSPIETVRVPVGPRKDDYIVKCYISPTKRRGIERRSLLYTIVRTPNGSEVSLADVLKCGIPITCCGDDCIVCQLYGGVIAGQNISLQGRLCHGGGTAIQALGPIEKFRSRVPTLFKKGPSEIVPDEYKELARRAAQIREEIVGFPMPFRREYIEPGHTFPITNHGLLLNSREIDAAIFAFLASLALIGAGTPKGVNIFYGPLLSDKDEPYIVFDVYKIPLGEKVIISPFEMDIAKAVEHFKALSQKIAGIAKKDLEEAKSTGIITVSSFKRYVGDVALKELQKRAKKFYDEELPAYVKEIWASRQAK